MVLCYTTHNKFKPKIKEYNIPDNKITLNKLGLLVKELIILSLKNKVRISNIKIIKLKNKFNPVKPVWSLTTLK